MRNQLFHFLYTHFLKNIFFRLDPEMVHDRMTSFGQFLGNNKVGQKLTHLMFHYSHPALEQEILGIKFANPVGLAAGFDKDANLTGILPEVGFGFTEVGSITGEPCAGNPKPRLWRLKKSRGLVVNYGLKNDGSEKISRKLKSCRFQIPIGTSISKTNNQTTTETKQGIADYLKAYRLFTNIGSYFTINISCPNAFGGLPFSDPQKLDQLLQEIDQIPTKKPIFLKLSPDLTLKEVDQIINIAGRYKVAGFVCSNLTKNRKNPKLRIVEKKLPGQGGISGKVVEKLADEQIAYIYRKTKGKFVVIGCGGVFSAEDAYKKIRLGASLIQLITGMIFEGPQVISQINQGLVKLLQADGYKNISQAVGKGIK